MRATDLVLERGSQLLLGDTLVHWLSMSVQVSGSRYFPVSYSFDIGVIAVTGLASK